ncbi:MAG: nuclear transport factor 2 family protein [Ilumatobacteraceae bacterium]
MDVDLHLVAVEARLLQNAYAHAIDTRDWELFRTVFAPDVVADYPQRRYAGMTEWLDEFVPFHDACSWTLHVMSNHLVGRDASGVWASCYGDVRWQMNTSADRYSHALGVYQDRLALVDGAWVVAHRTFRMVMYRPNIPMPDGMTMPTSVRALMEEN